MAWQVVLGEIVFHGLYGMLEAVASTGERAADRDRRQAARDFLAQHAAEMRERDGRTVGRLHADRGGAEVTLHGDRVRIACPWDGGGIRVAAVDPRAHVLPRLIAPLRRIGGVDRIASNGRTLEVAGPLALGCELHHATRSIAEVTSIGRRTRERIASTLPRAPARTWSVVVTAGGAQIVLQRATSFEQPLAFSIDAAGRLVTETSTHPPDAMCQAIGRGPVRVELARGRAKVSWPDLPTEAHVAAIERALTAAAPVGPYR